MATTTIRVSTQTHRALARLAQEADLSMADVVEQAIELYRRQRILDEANAAYAALRQNPEAWAEIQAERATWDRTVGDGLLKA
jgi:predicted transcriptional regulator